MPPRGAPQQKIDDLAFTVRIRLKILERGFGIRYNEMLAWLRDAIPAGDHAVRAGARQQDRDTASFHFRTLHDAERFMQQFPETELAHGTMLSGYASRCFPSVGGSNWRD